jgi:OmpA-OmpF porin, OOP family
MMKKIFLGLLILCASLQVNAQDFNKWSIDLGIGAHDAIFPLSPGYKTGVSFGLASLGARYMLNEKFGLRLDFAYHEFNEGSNSNPFKSNYYRTSIEGIVNAGNLLGFESWTSRFNLLFHTGVGFSMLNTIQPIDNGGDPMLNFIVGITPQFKITDRVSLFADFSSVFHQFQSTTFDGAVNNAERQTNASLINASIGVSVAIGKKEKHADFWREKQQQIAVANTDLENIKMRLDTAEKEIEVLKTKEPIVNKEVLVKELDTRYARIGSSNNTNRYSNSVTASNVDLIRELLNRGYVNVYFDVNKSTVQKSSINAVNYLKQFMMDNPYVSASLIGFADESGKLGYNQSLSRKRAKAVFDILVAAGISSSRLSYTGGGEDQSVDKGARQLARKVAFKINN